MIPILLIGHGINLFMSTISSFVHPLRLTFVEFSRTPVSKWPRAISTRFVK